jgi:class 3 adenylate cyclase/sensor domain CHASE-containing protein
MLSLNIIPSGSSSSNDPIITADPDAPPSEVDIPVPSSSPLNGHQKQQRRGTAVTSNVSSSNVLDPADPSPPSAIDMSEKSTSETDRVDSSGSGYELQCHDPEQPNGSDSNYDNEKTLDDNRPRRRVSYAGSVQSTDTPSAQGTKSTARSSRRSSSMSMSGIWGDFTRRSSLWEMDSLYSVDDEDRFSCKACFVSRLESTGRWFRSTLTTAFSKPSILIPSLLLYIALVVCGMLIVYGFDNATAESRKQTAISVAEQTDLFFVRILENAFLPLFTLSMFIQELPEFHDLDLMVGDRCDATLDPLNCTESTSAPPMPGKETTHRDLSGLFNSTEGQLIQRKFDTIASGIKENSGLGKALVNIQMAPKGVVSLLYPMVNCDDFIGNPRVEEGYCMNNTGAFGHDLLNDPARVGIARATVPADGVVTAGPLNLIQGGDTFIARLPINMDPEDGHIMVVDDVTYPCWGFVVVLLDWSTLKEQSNIYKEFENEKMQFKLTRTDVIDGEEVVKSIAESANSELCASGNVTLDLDTGDNNWVISVCYNDGFSPNYKVWAYPIVFIGSFIFMILMMLVLVSKSQLESILLKLMPARAIRKLRKGETIIEKYDMVTIFFSDIVGYTQMSSEMTPREVMKMLNDLYSRFDIIAAKYGVYKVETIGDAYIGVAGCPNKCSGPEAAQRMALFALEAMKVVDEYQTDDGALVRIRAGLASGPVVAGVIGTSLPKYTLFGDTVNFAARMEQTSKKMKIQISPATQRMLLDAPAYEFECEERRDDSGELGVEVKGKGRQYTYWVKSATKLPEKKSNEKDEIFEHLDEKV